MVSFGEDDRDTRGSPVTPEPPSGKAVGQDEGVPAASPDPQAPGEPIAGRSRVAWPSIVTGAVVLAIAGGAGWSLFDTQSSQPRKESAPLARGLACPYLLQAADAYAQGDQSAFRQKIQQAARVAQDTLQTSGQAFGDPERVSIELDLAADLSPTRTKRLLELAVGDCQDLGAA